MSFFKSLERALYRLSGLREIHGTGSSSHSKCKRANRITWRRRSMRSRYSKRSSRVKRDRGHQAWLTSSRGPNCHHPSSSQIAMSWRWSTLSSFKAVTGASTSAWSLRCSDNLWKTLCKRTTTRAFLWNFAESLPSKFLSGSTSCTRSVASSITASIRGTFFLRSRSLRCLRPLRRTASSSSKRHESASQT